MMSLSAARRRISVMKQRSHSLHFWPSAGVGARVELVPESASLGQFREFGAVAALRRFLPRGDGAVMIDFFQTAEHRLAGEIKKLLAAK